MDYADLLSRLEIFFSEVCYSALLKAVQDREALVVDFSDIEKFDVDAADCLLEGPEEFFKAAEEAMRNVDVGEELESQIHFRIKGLPESQTVSIKNLRSKHLKKFIAVEGIIKQASEVRPEIVLATFECRACGERIMMLQEEQDLTTPYMCECGNKRGFEMVERKMVDIQRLEVEESPEALEGSAQARKIGVFIKNDLVDPKFQKRVVPGSKIVVTGVLDDVPIKSDNKGKESKRRDIYIDGNYVEPIEFEFEDIEVSAKDEKRIKELAANPKIYDLLADSIAPSIYGYRDIKQAISLQLFGGVRKKRPDGVVTRGDIHVLLVGDPGSGKSQLLKYTSGLAPKARYVVGKSTSGAGLTATVVKDEFMRGWALEAGALVLANKGLVAIDELDKMSTEDRSSMHEVAEQQTVTVSKANIQATLNAQTTILAAANPKFGRFDPYQSIPEQIDIPDTLLSRFDLIFPIRDEPNKEKDTLLVRHILKMHENPEIQNPPLDSDILRKYISYVKANVKPKLTKPAQNVIEKFYVGLRSKYAGTDEVSSVPIGARQLEALVRLSEASARVRLSDTVKKEDAQRAIKLLTDCLMQVGIDPETGKFDIDRLESGTTSTQRNKIKIILTLVSEMQKDSADKSVLIEDIKAAAEEQGLEDAEEIIQKLKREGELFEPKHGHIRRV